MKVHFTKPVIKESDSSFKKFVKEFYHFGNTRYTLLKDGKVDKSQKNSVWKENALKVALCFTIIVPILAGIYKLREMHNLSRFTLTLSDKAKRTSDNINELRFGDSGIQINTKEVDASEGPKVERLLKVLSLLPLGEEFLEDFKELIKTSREKGKLIYIKICPSNSSLPEDISVNQAGCKYIQTFTDDFILGFSTEFLNKFVKLAEIQLPNTRISSDLESLLTQVLKEIKQAVAPFKIDQIEEDTENPDEQFTLGLCYEFGVGVEIDEKKSSAFHEKSLKNGCDKAIIRRYMASKKVGVEELAKAKAFLKSSSAEAKDPISMTLDILLQFSEMTEIERLENLDSIRRLLAEVPSRHWFPLFISSAFPEELDQERNLKELMALKQIRTVSNSLGEYFCKKGKVDEAIRFFEYGTENSSESQLDAALTLAKANYDKEAMDFIEYSNLLDSKDAFNQLIDLKHTPRSRVIWLQKLLMRNLTDEIRALCLQFLVLNLRLSGNDEPQAEIYEKEYRALIAKDTPNPSAI